MIKKYEDYSKQMNSKLLTEIELLKKKIVYYKYDHLTGLLLRKDFESNLENLWYDYSTAGIRFIYAIVDINDLKRANTEHGRLYGDAYVTSVAEELKKYFEDSFIYRIGGDEFCILRKGNDYKNFVKRLDKLNNVQYGVVICDEKTSFKNIDELSTYIDRVMTEKKIKSKRRKSDYEI